MSPKTLVLLMLLALPTLTGCGRFATERHVVWAQMGTPARIVDDRPVEILVSDGNGGWQSGTGRLAGMVAIDEPTLEYYQNLDHKSRQANEAPSR
jgi:hypothetical protein